MRAPPTENIDEAQLKLRAASTVPRGRDSDSWVQSLLSICHFRPTFTAASLHFLIYTMRALRAGVSLAPGADLARGSVSVLMRDPLTYTKPSVGSVISHQLTYRYSDKWASNWLPKNPVPPRASQGEPGSVPYLPGLPPVTGSLTCLVPAPRPPPCVSGSE